MQKFAWTIPIIIAVALIEYFLVLPMMCDSEKSADAESLIAELNAVAADIDKAIAESSVKPELKVLERSLKRIAELSKKTDELVPRLRNTVPTLKGDTFTRFRDAQDNYVKKHALLGAKLNEVQKQIDELNKKQR